MTYPQRGNASADGSPKQQVAASGVRRFIPATAFFLGGAAGFWVGQPFGYAVASVVGRDPADLKGMLIACFITMPIFMSAVFTWLAVIATGRPRTSQATALGWLIFVTVGTLIFVISSYEWQKSSGIPVVEYELRLPIGTAISDKQDINLTVWSETGGTGCYIASLQHIAGRPQLSGHIVVQLGNQSPIMSLRLPETSARNETSLPFVQKSPEGYWRLPYSPQSQLELGFTPWQVIEFNTAPRAVPPLPPGEYEIRYRLREYM